MVLVMPVAVLSAATSQGDRAAILAPTTDFTKAEKWESLPGGSATNRKRFGRDAFSQPSANLSFAERSDFSIGNGLFRRLWVSAPSSTQTADGLGPLYNARACQRCHLKDGRGHPPASADDSAVSMFLRLSIPPQTPAQEAQLAALRASVIPEPTYGGQLQDLAIPGQVGEGRMAISYEEVPFTLGDDTVVILRKPTYSIDELAYGPLHEDVMLSPRVASQMIGLGLLEAVDEADILAAEDPEDTNGDGISGRANRVWSDLQGAPALGRFGWKAGMASLAEQNAGALAGDVGVSNPLHTAAWGDCTAAQEDCRAGPHGVDGSEGALEATEAIMEPILFYARNLAVPARRDIDDPEVLRGKELFYGANCIGCHTPKFATRRDHEEKALAGQLIWPYSDMLLHDMGDGLADNRPEGLASGSEWRTAPLWGIGHTQSVSGHSFFLHDGRARSLTEAVLWHDGEAAASRDSFAAMPAVDRDAVIKFLESM